MNFRTFLYELITSKGFLTGGVVWPCMLAIAPSIGTAWAVILGFLIAFVVLAFWCGLVVVRYERS